MNKKELEELLADYQRIIDGYTQRKNEIIQFLFAEYLNNEMKLKEHKTELYYAKNKLGNTHIQFPYELATKIHQWIYDHKIKMNEYNCNNEFNFNGVYVKVFDNHYASVEIRFENKEIENKFMNDFEFIS